MNRPKAEVKAEQDYIAKHHNLGWWYGTGCKTCCGVYPKFMTVYTPDMPCYFQCEVCGKRTENFNMPWQAEEAWNSGETFYPDRRISLFELEEE